MIVRRFLRTNRIGRPDSINEQILFNSIWMPLAVRIHFEKLDAESSDGETLGEVVIRQLCSAGAIYGVELHRAIDFGFEKDLNLVWLPEENGGGWIFSQGDGIHVAWSNPGNIAWGMQVMVGYLGIKSDL